MTLPTGDNLNSFDFEFEDAETYRGSNDKFSFRIIVLNQIAKIANNVNVEFRGGYWQQKVVPLEGGNSKVTEEYVPDTREIYSNSVEFLHDLLYPHFQDNKQMKKASEEYDINLAEAMNTFMKDGVFDDKEKLLFRDLRVRLCRRLFISLSLFLEKVNYFGERSV